MAARVTPILQGPEYIPCDICHQPVHELDVHCAHEPDCPKRGTDYPCGCDINTCPDHCPDCYQDYP